MAMDLLLHPALREPLAQCYGGQAEGIQTMYFWQGSEQRRHQDQFYLPGCMSAWLALQDVSEVNGTIYVQPGSHRKHLLTKAELTEKLGDDYETVWGGAYNDGVDEVFEKNGGDEIPVEVSKGDVVLFHGILIHRGGPINDKGSFPYDFDDWPHRTWPRFDFDGVKRLHPEPDAV
jgi:ectoine hydroxylase-related dioxygenase (phytanoyl-CoA dioxygenase family)